LRQTGHRDVCQSRGNDNEIERCWDGSGYEGGDDDNSVIRRRNQVAHLVESAKLAVRAAAYVGEELASRRRGA
jgi:hypothetical protein